MSAHSSMTRESMLITLSIRNIPAKLFCQNLFVTKVRCWIGGGRTYFFLFFTGVIIVIPTFYFIFYLVLYHVKCHCFLVHFTILPMMFWLCFRCFRLISEFYSLFMRKGLGNRVIMSSNTPLADPENWINFVLFNPIFFRMLKDKAQIARKCIKTTLELPWPLSGPLHGPLPKVSSVPRS